MKAKVSKADKARAEIVAKAVILNLQAEGLHPALRCYIALAIFGEATQHSEDPEDLLRIFVSQWRRLQEDREKSPEAHAE